jgi:Flp pilus assembly protein TadG
MPHAHRPQRAAACTHDRSAGNAPLELVILAPVLLALIALVIAAGRTVLAQNSVAAAARDAARQASIARTAGEARANARSGALSELAQQGLHCTSTSVHLNLAGFGVPPGLPASVSATVTCHVSLADLALPGLPGSRTLVATFSSPLDPYRGR